MNNETLETSKWFLENQSWIIPLLVTLLSLFGALIGGWLSGRKKIGIEVISKNRQDWIHELRDIVKDFLTKSSELFKIYSGKNHEKKGSSPTLSTLTELFNYLELLLNPNESESNKILTSCQKIIEFFADLEEEIPPLNSLDITKRSHFDSRLYSYQKELTKNTQNVLKTEWERVKKGI